MFLTIQKITTATSTRRSRILVNADEIMLMEVDSFYDRDLNLTYDATRIEISGHQAIFTQSTFTDLSTAMAMVDVRGGVGTGYQWENDPGVVDFTYPLTSLPYLRCNMIFNSSRTTLNDYIFNPKYLIFAEEVKFNDTITKDVQDALLIVLRDSAPKRILTDLSYDDLSTLLSATDVPVP